MAGVEGVLARLMLRLFVSYLLTYCWSLAYLGFPSFCKNTGLAVLQKGGDLEKLYELVSDNQFSCTGAFKLSPLIFPMFQRS